MTPHDLGKHQRAKRRHQRDRHARRQQSPRPHERRRQNQRSRSTTPARWRCWANSACSVGTTNATNLLTQGGARRRRRPDGQGRRQSRPLTLTFGAGNIETIGDLNTALAGLAGGTASADPSTGNITVTATGPPTRSRSAARQQPNFGIHTLTALPSNGTVVAQDDTSFLSETIGGGAVTGYDASGAAVNVQLRWAKVDSSTLGAGHTDTWNLFYQTNSNATGTEVGLEECRRRTTRSTPTVSSIRRSPTRR